MRMVTYNASIRSVFGCYMDEVLILRQLLKSETNVFESHRQRNHVLTLLQPTSSPHYLYTSIVPAHGNL
ncbi:hypothetical protein SprV_0301380100 [Sparganum proliferum]